MNGVAYTRYELRRTFRNRRFFLFSLGFPLVFYWLLAVPQRNNHNFAGSGLSVPLYYMVGLAAFGTMVSMISTGARIAGERQAGWTRQLRISPLPARAYFRAKVLTGYGMAVSSLLLLYASGVALGVSLPAQRWLGMTALILVGLLPFAALGILIGHLVTTDSVGPSDRGRGIDTRLPRRHMVPDHQRLSAHAGAVPAFVVARSGQPRRARRSRMGRPRLAHGCCLDGDPLRQRRLGLPR